jgi:hypothetical protein
MKKSITLIFSLALAMLVSLTAAAQEYAFKVLGSKGNNTVNGTPLKVGSKIEKSQSIVVDGDYLGLASSNGKTIEIKNKGTYKADELLGKLTGTASITNKYYDFVVAELTNGEDVAASKKRAEHMAKTGSVQRDIGALSTMLHTTNNMFGSELVVKWYLRDNAGIKDEELQGYKVIISDLSDNVLLNKVVNDRAATINLTEGKLASEEQLLIKVVPVGKDGKEKISANTVDGNAIVRLDQDTRSSIEAELASLIPAEHKGTALGKLIEARFYEDRELYVDAIRAYEQAIVISSGTEQYKRIYQYFLDRNLLSKESRMAIESDSK